MDAGTAGCDVQVPTAAERVKVLTLRAKEKKCPETDDSDIYAWYGKGVRHLHRSYDLHEWDQGEGFCFDESVFILIIVKNVLLRYDVFHVHLVIFVGCLLLWV